MIQVAVVDDEKSFRDRIDEYLKQYSRESHQVLRPKFYTDGVHFTDDSSVKFDIVLMDIQMNQLDGMTAAEILRKQDPAVVIIFITNTPQYAIRGYQVGALDYMLKPVSYFEFAQRMDRALRQLESQNKRFITVQVKSGLQRLELGRIRYIESEQHDLVYRTDDGDFAVRGTMKALESELAEKGFFRINSGCLVNLDRVDSVLKEDAVVAGISLPISRGRRSEFMTVLAAHVGGRLG